MASDCNVGSQHCEDACGAADDARLKLLEPNSGQEERRASSIASVQLVRWRPRYLCAATALVCIWYGTCVSSHRRWWRDPAGGIAEKAQRLPPAAEQKFVRVAARSRRKHVVQICPSPEEDTDYQLEELGVYADVESQEVCQQGCSKDARCGAWAWGAAEGMKGITHMCYFKIRPPGSDLAKVQRFGIVAGLPCSESKVQPPRTDFPDQFPEHSLLCFALMQPEGYEPVLTRMQFDQGVGIFECDEYTVYSNQEIEVAPGVVAHQVDSDLKCKYGGEFNTALNTPIFFAVWDKVKEDGRYRLHEWTVKADPDCVFFPSRLRVVLEAYAPPPENGLYINNCKYGMHGPIEVFSTAAVDTWVDGKSQCSDYFDELCSGDCMWGEDMFADQCLKRVFKVPRVNDWSILAEDHCDPQKGWESCEDRSKVAFHPYKTQDSYLQCLRGAGALEEVLAF